MGDLYNEQHNERYKQWQNFYCLFHKKDGYERVINCRTKVKKGVTGKGMSYNPKDLGYLVVYDLKCNDFRMINLNTLKWVKAEGNVYHA